MAGSVKLSRRFLEKNFKTVTDLMENELTSTQKCYIIMYYRDSKTVRQIADECGVNPSTVSRTIKRGTDKFYRAIENAMELYEKCG